MSYMTYSTYAPEGDEKSLGEANFTIPFNLRFSSSQLLRDDPERSNELSHQ